MTSEIELELQEQVFEYFKDIDDATFIKIVESFVYHQPNKGVGEIIEKFLKENKLDMAYANYISDLRDERKKATTIVFYRCSMSERSVIEGIKQAFLNASFNRFRRSFDNNLGKKYAKLEKEIKQIREVIDKLMDAGTNERYHEALDDLRDMQIDRKRKKK